MKRLIAVAGIVLISAGLASAADLAAYKATYEKQMEGIILTHGMKMTELGQQYSTALDVLLAKVKKDGDLDKTTAVLEELARFRDDKGMPRQPSHLLDIQNLQAVFARQASAHETDKAQNVISLAVKYDQALERLQRSLVSASKLDDAKAVQEERNRVEQEEPVKSAHALIRSSGVMKHPAGSAHEPTTAQSEETYTLTVVTKTGLGKYDPSDGSDRVRMYVFLGNDDSNKKELRCGGFGRGSELTFDNIEFDYPLEKINQISLLCQGGTDAWGMDSVSFQFFRRNKHKCSKQYQFKERVSFSGEGADTASTLKSFQIVGGVQINRVYFESGGLK